MKTMLLMAAILLAGTAASDAAAQKKVETTKPKTGTTSIADQAKLTVPTVVSFTINKGEAVAYDRTLTLQWELEPLGNPTHVRISELPNFQGAFWYGIAQAPKSYTLGQNIAGAKTLHIQFKNATGEGAATSAQIEYRTPILISQTRLNKGAAETNNRAVELELAFEHGPPTHFRMGENGNLDNVQWKAFSDMTMWPAGQAYPLSLPYTLTSPGYGMKNVYVQLRRDSPQNASPVASSQIEYRTRPELSGMPASAKANTRMSMNLMLSGLSADVARIRRATPTNDSRYCLFQNSDGTPAAACEAVSQDDETFRLSFIGHFDEYRNACQFLLSVQTEGFNGQLLESFLVFAPGGIVIDQGEPAKTLIVENTYDLLNYLEIGEGHIANSSSFGLCSGTLTGPAGSFAVGVTNQNGDIAILTRSAPSGTTCDRRLAASRLRLGWGLNAVFEEKRSGTNCEVSRTGEPKDGRLTKYTFGRGKTFVGWTSVNDIFGTRGKVGDSYIRQSPTLFTTCKPTVSNDNEVASIIKQIEILVPQGAMPNPTWQDAFSP